LQAPERRRRGLPDAALDALAAEESAEWRVERRVKAALAILPGVARGVDFTEMDDRTNALLALAFDRARAPEANLQIDRHRRELDAQSYEMVINPEETFPAFADRVVPRLVYHLEAKKRRLPGCEGVFLSVFLEDDLFFIHARDAVAFFAQSVGTTVSELASRYGSDSTTLRPLPK
jgi:hypothetical protein